jgi:hypothetical protein
MYQFIGGTSLTLVFLIVMLMWVVFKCVALPPSPLQKLRKKQCWRVLP